MFQSTQQGVRSGAAAAAVDIAPLIDIVFILLIFFLVTATFVRPTGVTVDRPRASQSEALEPESLRLSIAQSGAVYADGEELSLTDLRQRVRDFVTGRELAHVIVIPDRRVSSGRLVEVMDEARAGGASQVAVATERRGGGS